MDISPAMWPVEPGDRAVPALAPTSPLHTPKGSVMTSLRTAFDRRRSTRAHLREERALARALAGAPTLESAHEIATLATRR